MKLLKIAPDKYVNTERITYIDAKKRDKVIIQFQNEVGPWQPYVGILNSPPPIPPH